MQTHLLFLIFVALAVYAQTLTGFALALILLGLVGATNLIPLVDAINAVTVIMATTAGTFLYRRWPLRLEQSLWPAFAASVVGAVAGTILLTWLADTAYEVLRLILGISVVLCALLLWHAAEPLKTVSSRSAFVVSGGISGLLGGMFSAPGPPLVYLMYRQPLPHARIQESLILFFGMGALLRLALVVPAGQFSLDAVQLAAEAIPVVFVVTSFAAIRPPPLRLDLLRAIAMPAPGGDRRRNDRRGSALDKPGPGALLRGNSARPKKTWDRHQNVLRVPNDQLARPGTGRFLRLGPAPSGVFPFSAIAPLSHERHRRDPGAPDLPRRTIRARLIDTGHHHEPGKCRRRAWLRHDEIPQFRKRRIHAASCQGLRSSAVM